MSALGLLLECLTLRRLPEPPTTQRGAWLLGGCLLRERQWGPHRGCGRDRERRLDFARWVAPSGGSEGGAPPAGV